MWLFLVILGLIALIGGIFGGNLLMKPNVHKDNFDNTRDRTSDGQKNAGKWIRRLGPALGVFFITFGFILTSLVFVDTKHTVHLTKKYGTSHLAPGRVIAIDGEMGRQSRLFQEGVNFEWFVNIFNRTLQVENTVVIRTLHLYKPKMLCMLTEKFIL